MGSMNYAKYSESRKDFVFKMVFENTFDEIIELLNAMNELGIRPEHECFDVGHVGSLARWWTWACCTSRCTWTWSWAWPAASRQLRATWR